MRGSFFLCAWLFGQALSSPSVVQRDLSSLPPTVTLDSATVTGLNNGTLTKFLGIPFAQPPVGDLRFNLPQPVGPYSGSINATVYGASCPQQKVTFPISFKNIFNFTTPFMRKNSTNDTVPVNPPNENEDCLTINVIKPTNVSADAKLPVVVWIFGGGFERGNTVLYDGQGSQLVNRSVELGQPLIYVSMNYRVSAWGFLASREVLDAKVGNMGLYDQYVALKWVQKYVNTFGGDNTKVTIWGQSAGSISVSLQMLAFGGNSTDLFRGGFMQSGSPIPVGNVTGGQMYYDSLVTQTNCTGSQDTLACLRNVPSDNLRVAIDNTPNYFSYQALALAWMPRADGVFLQDNPQRLVQEGKVVAVPIVNGVVDDEGTLFSFSSRNVTTEPEFQTYVNTYFLPGANQSMLEPLWADYPPNPAAGSPFNTTTLNAITPQYKRIASFQGDAVFQAPRRFFLQNYSGKQKIWSYLSKKLKLTPFIGSFHGSDLEGHILDDYLVRFATNLDPNNGTGVPWPEYTTESPLLYTFPRMRSQDPEISKDTYRLEAMQTLTNLSLVYPL